ncbi:hypothetical protein [Massilia sp. BSC265]|uniref:hypothetical protein n=1 Tax=Massilia sp. BSC265 TaxID=1549812 RepID=UPI000689D3F3|nr:hypothetical protein [Massilia sp. BSC265]
MVKDFNHLFAALLATDPRTKGGQRLLFVAADDPPAKAQVAGLAGQLSYLPVDPGGLAKSGRLTQFPGGALTAMNLVKFG